MNILGYLDSTIVNIGFAIAVFFLAVFLLKYLWNSTFPEIFSLKEITYWQALRILLLAMMLTGGSSSLVSFTKNYSQETVKNGNGNVTSIKNTEKSSITIGN